MANNNTMPYNLEAEQSVLGCILIDQVVQSDIISLVKPYDFMSKAHSLIFDGICEVFSTNVPVDLVTLSDNLQKNGKIDSVGGIKYLTELTRVVPSSANYMRYIDIIKRDGILRKLIVSANKIIENASNSLDSKKSLDYAEQLIFDISENDSRKDLENIKEYLEPVIEKFEKLETDKNFHLGLNTGFTRLDHMTNGLHNGNLIIIGARPSVGKTTFAMNIVENVSLRENVTCAVFALEMGKDELAQRMLCSVANLNMDEALKGKLTDNKPNAFADLWKAKRSLDRTKIFVDESTNLTVQDILAKCRKLKVRFGLDLIVVDHIQLMEAVRKSDSRQQEVTEISRGLKMIAKELNVPVIALSQLSRQVTGRKGGKPILSDLRESGAIEQDADLVIFLHRGEMDADAEAKKTTLTNTADVIIAKNRNGMIGEMQLLFKGENVKFVNIDGNKQQSIANGNAVDTESAKNNSNTNNNANSIENEEVDELLENESSEN